MKLLVVTKQQLRIACCVLVVAIASTVASVNAFAGGNRKLPIYCVETEKKQVAISFDAAWGNDDTENLINILKEYNVPATFFVVGAWVDKYPESVKQLCNAGHRIENHSNTHPHMPSLSPTQMADEITACNKKITKVAGRTPTLFRCPYGDYDNATVSAVESLNMKAVQWSVDSLDWKDNSTAESICTRVVSKVQPGSIVLFHNDAEHTPEALPGILKSLKAKGYEFVFIEDLLLKDNYEIQHDGKQCRIK